MKISNFIRHNYHRIRSHFRYYYYYLKLLRKKEWYLLNEFTKEIAKNCDHLRYEKVLKIFDQELNLNNITGLTFEGSGQGWNSLSTYRKTVYKNTACFEKVYLKESDNYTKAKWFDSCSGLLLPNLNKAKIITEKSGRNLSVLYFEYIHNFRPANYDQALTTSIEFTISAVNKTKGIDKFSVEHQEVITDFCRDSKYKDGHHKLELWVHDLPGKEKKIHKKIEDILKKTDQRCLTHGDICTPNISKDGTLVDFDAAGYYPVGFDFAYTISMCADLADFNDLLELYHRLIREFNPLKQQGLFELSFFYFSFMFIIRRQPFHRTVVDDEFLVKHWEALINLYSNY